MEMPWNFVVIFFICLPLQCLAASLDIANRNEIPGAHFGTQESGLAPSNSPSTIQSWNDWLKKRSFGDLTFGDQNLQAWKEWMDKRGLHPGSRPSFGESQVPAFQPWHDWLEKRANSGLPLTQAQKDWLVKRGLGALSGGHSGSSFGQPTAGNFQSWGEYSKRSDPIKDAGSWMEHVDDKRNFGLVRPSNPFSVPFGHNPHLMKWDDMMKRRSDKRQLGNGPMGFGHNKQYFASGLQDWRNTFQGSKRTTNNDKSSKEKNN